MVHDRYTLYDTRRSLASSTSCALSTSCVIWLVRARSTPKRCGPARSPTALRGLIHATNLARDKGEDQVDPDVRAELVKTLRHGVLAGLSDTTSHGTRPGEAKARALLEVLRDSQEDILGSSTT